MQLELFIAIGGVVILTIIFMALGKKKKLSPEALKRAEFEIGTTKSLDPAHAVLEAHKIFVFTLATLIPEQNRKSIRAADTITKFAKRFPNAEHIWKSHRLRNRIAHEPGINVTPTHADLARRNFIRALRALS